MVGVVGVGAQWLAYRLQLPAIVLMLLAGIFIGPVLGIFDPARDIGVLTGPMISIAVAVILFEGGLSLNLQGLGDAAVGVRRLVAIGAPLGWVTSTFALHYGAGIGWEAATVFGGIMIVTGPTVIAPLLRQARLERRPAALLQWEAIVNDPIGALAAVLAFGVVQVLNTPTSASAAAVHFAVGIIAAAVLGYGGGSGIAASFRRGLVPEYMKVPVLFTTLLATFALSDRMLHESGLLAVTVMGVVIANANLPSYVELRRFKEHATILLVSGVFILLAAGLDIEALSRLDWRAAVFVAIVVLVARPVSVLTSLIGTEIPWRERLLVALTGPRGVVLMAVAGLFGDRLAKLGVPDAELIGPLAFVLVAASVVIHGFALTPLARSLDLRAAETPGLLLVGGTRFTIALGETLQKAGISVLVSDMNRGHLRGARSAKLETFFGDILSEAAEHTVELIGFKTVLAATDNDAYNTLVTTDLAPEFGRDNVWQLARSKSENVRYALPVTLGGRSIGNGTTYDEFDQMLASGWVFRTTRLTEEFTFEAWQAKRPNALLVGWISPSGGLRFAGNDEVVKAGPGTKLISLLPPGAIEAAAPAPVDQPD